MTIFALNNNNNKMNLTKLNAISPIDGRYRNKITKLDNLPVELKELYCGLNQITYLDNLPQILKTLNCFNNNIIYLP